jgi:hypothetical protein
LHNNTSLKTIYFSLGIKNIYYVFPLSGLSPGTDPALSGRLLEVFISVLFLFGRLAARANAASSADKGLFCSLPRRFCMGWGITLGAFLTALPSISLKKSRREIKIYLLVRGGNKSLSTVRYPFILDQMLVYN